MATCAVVDPVGQSVDVVLRDGSTVHIRPVRQADRVGIRTFLGALCSESVGLRFFGAADLDWASGWSAEVDDANRCGLVATSDPGETIVGHGAYVREDATRAETAFVVADALHELGIATILLRRLATHAKAHGILVLTAVVLSYNRRMIDVFRDSGYPVTLRTLDGETHVELTTSLAYIEPWLGGGWAVKLFNHPVPVSRHDTEDEARDRAAAYERGLETEARGPTAAALT
jgi:acetate---CoA ligase (ADP-forming)